MAGTTRRGFIAGGAAATALTGCGGLSGGETDATRLDTDSFGLTSVRAGETMFAFEPARPEPVPVWAYDGSVPGRGVRVTQGRTVRRKFINRLPEPSTIHWHGMRIDNAMDGVAGMTQDPVPPGGEFTYRFVAKDAGTFWYHPHTDATLSQLGRGLSAPLIVRETTPPDTDADLSLLINGFDFDAAGQIIDPQTGGARTARLLTINGAAPFQWRTKRGERLRLRLINGTVGQVLTLALQGMTGTLVARDGMPLATPQRGETVTLAPAQRADFLADITEDDGGQAAITGGGQRLAVLPVSGIRTRAQRPTPAPLPPNPMPALDLANAQRVSLRMEGGQVGGLTSALVRGEGRLGRDALAERGLAWTINGWAGMPEAPEFTASRGETVRITIVNANPVPHAMHVHGHHFREVGAGGLGPWLDTILIGANARAEIALNADNPGMWMLHCHMLEHHAQGMMTMFRVLA